MVNANHVCSHKGYKFAINPQVPDSQDNTTCVKGGAGKECNLLYHSQSLCCLPVPNIPAGKHQGKAALCCFYSGWTSFSTALTKHEEGCKRQNSLFSCLPREQLGREGRQQVTCCCPAAGSTLFILGVHKDFTRAYRKAAASPLWGPSGSISILTDASLSWNSIDMLLPFLQSKLHTDCLTFSSTVGTPLPASSLCSSDTWSFMYT